MDVAVAYRLQHGTLHPGSTTSASDFQHEKSIPQYFGLPSLGSCTALHYRTPFNRSNEVWVTPLQPHGSEMARPCFFSCTGEEARWLITLPANNLRLFTSPLESLFLPATRRLSLQQLNPFNPVFHQTHSWNDSRHYARCGKMAQRVLRL